MTEGPIERHVTGDAGDRVSGHFPFAIDRQVENAVHVCAVRSSSPHGVIAEIDATYALDTPGVIAVVTGAHAHELLGPAIFHGESRKDQPVLALEKVRYVGEPIALVVAESRELAQRAVRDVDVEIDELPYLVDHDEADRPDAPQLHDEWPENACGEWKLVHGDAHAAMNVAAHVHTQIYRTPSVSHAAMEPHVASAQWSGDVLEVWTGTQAPYVVRNRLAGIFGLDADDVRIRADNIGGGFGGKLDVRLEAMVALASRVVGRPARMLLSRDEVFATAARHASTVKVTTGVDHEGKFVARIIDIVYNAGAYALSTPRAIRNGMIRSGGPYRIPNVFLRAEGRYTNTVPTGPFRGAMTGQVCWAGESELDELAAQIGMDPYELRLRNVLRDGDQFATGEVMNEMHYEEIVDAAASAVDWGGGLPPERDGVVHGRGMALVLKSTRTPSRSEAKVVLNADGELVIRSSSIEMGQGAHYTLTEMAASVLGVAAEDIAITVVDTMHTPFDTVTSSSRTTLSMGLAIEDGARKLRALIEDEYRELTDSPGPFTHDGGSVGGPGGGPLTYREIMLKSAQSELVGFGTYTTAEGYGNLDPETSQGLHTVSWHQGGVAVEVAVDTLTGRVQVVRAHGSSFAGRAIDEERIRKQTEGGVIFGIGQALMEEIVYDGGELSNGNFSDYQLPSILDVPVDISSSLFTDPDPEAPPHGVGENTVPPVPPAIGNAIFAATGARIRELPLTAERVLRAIEEVSDRHDEGGTE